MMDEIKKLKLYYQEFHHKCISWYLTVMGFFVAGAIAADAPDISIKETLGYSLIAVTFVLFLAFLATILLYGKRIYLLGQYINGEIDPPDDWEVAHKKVGFALKGMGSLFFVVIMLVMLFAFIWLAILKYLS